MSRQAEAAQLDGSLALPFCEPTHFLAPIGSSLAAIVNDLIDAGAIERAWLPRLDVYVDDVRFPAATWRNVKPRPGRLVAVRARPGWDFLIQVAVNIAIAVGVNALMQAFVGGGPSAQSFEQIAQIDSSRNEVAPFRKVPVVLGGFRTFPCHAAKPYTLGFDEKVKLYMLLSWGLAPLALDSGSLQIGDTPITSYAGANVQHKLKPGDPWPTIFPSQVDQDDGPGLMEFADSWVALTTSSEDCEKLQVELMFPNGLIFYSGDGGIKSFGVDLRIRYREAGSSTWLDFSTGAAAAEGHLYELSGFRKRKPFRMNFERVVPRGQYEVAVKRAQADDPGPKGVNHFHWTKLTTFTFDPPVLDDNLAITAIEIEASDQLANQVDLINGVVRRIAPIWDPVSESFGAAAVTSNPAELVRWIATGPGAAKPRTPGTQTDEAALGAWAELCTLRGWNCDMELRAGAGQDEIMETVARCGRGALTERNGKLSVVVDDVQPAPSQLFSARNSWGFRSQRRYTDVTHALRCQFNNAEKDYVHDEMMVYYPGFDEESAEIIRTMPMVGKVSPLEVYQSAKRIIAEELLRCEDYVFRSDIEHLMTKRGKRVKLAHPVMAVGLRQARVTNLVQGGDGSRVFGVEIDEQIPQVLGEDYGIVFRRQQLEEIIVGSALVTNDAGASPGVVGGLSPFSDGAHYSDTAQNYQPELDLTNVIRFSAVGGVPDHAAPTIGDLIAFGEAEIETIDAIVTNVARSGSFEAELSAAPYADALFDGDLETLPPWESNVASAAFPAPPAPEIGGAIATGTGIFVDFTFPLDTARRVPGVEGDWREAADTSRFELACTLGAEERLAPFPAGERARSYVLKLVSIGARGQRVESEEISLDSIGASPPLTGTLTRPSAVIVTAPDGSGGDYANNAGGVFKVKLGDVDIVPIDPIDDEVIVAFSIESATAGLFITIDEDGVYAVSGLSEDYGQATLRANRNGVTVDLVYSIAKSRTGAGGTPSPLPSGFTATIPITSSSTGVNLRELANAAGYTGFSDAAILFTVASGVSIKGAPGGPNGGVAMDSGEFPFSEYAIDIKVENEGDIDGGGGKGGRGGVGNGDGEPGGKGGDAINCRLPMEVENKTGGRIRGGGSGGGGGGGADAWELPSKVTYRAGGGGGGGGKPNGPGGLGGPAGDGPGDDGGAGTGSTVGVGATGGDSGFGTGGDGADGGDYGAAGGAGDPGLGNRGDGDGGAPGAAGYAIRKNGHTVPVTNAGTITGTVG